MLLVTDGQRRQTGGASHHVVGGIDRDPESSRSAAGAEERPAGLVRDFDVAVLFTGSGDHEVHVRRGAVEVLQELVDHGVERHEAVRLVGLFEDDLAAVAVDDTEGRLRSAGIDADGQRGVDGGAKRGGGHGDSSGCGGRATSTAHI